MLRWLNRIDPVLIALFIVMGATVVAIVRWSLRGLVDEERRRYKQFFAALLIYPTSGTLAAAVLFLFGAIVNGIKGNIGEFQTMLAIGVSLGVLGVALWWCMFRWPEWERRK